MYQVIARKYRPRTFTELIGQEHVRTTIENAIGQQRIAHGYIFSGQRGTGKTTVARIFARCLNCENGPTISPCGECPSCREISLGNSPDVIEIDAASNRGINEMRELRESVRYRPARDRFKIFIIDEAHQITNEAFNALLKTLEEPPEWVVFVLCTTESHKIPNTIASRCQQFSFRSVDYDILLGLLERICGMEGIEAEPEALSIITLAGEGSVRDSLSALDQSIACCGQKLTAVDVRQLLGRFSIQTLEQVAEALLSRDAARMLDTVQELELTGQNLQHFCRELCRFFRNLLVARIAGAGTRLIAASNAERERLEKLAAEFSEEDLTRYLHLTLEIFGDLQYSLQPRMHLELGLVRLVHAGRLRSIEELLAGGGGASGSGIGSGGVTASAAVSAKPVVAKFTAPTAAAGTASKGTGAIAAPADAVSVARPSAARTAPAMSAPAISAAPAMSATPASNATSAMPVAVPASGAAGAVSKPIPGDLRSRLLEILNEKGMSFIADAVESSDLKEKTGELEFTTAKEFTMALRSGDLAKVVERLVGKALKITVRLGEVAAPVNAKPGVDSRMKDDEATRRALENPEVQRYRELFPGSEVRTVRNLKES